MCDTFDVTDFGATGDGVTNDRGAIQAAIDAAETAGRGTICFPAGTYNIGSGIDVTAGNIHLVGAGKGATVIRSTFASGHVITFGNGVTQIFNLGLRDLTVDTTVNRSSGAAVRVQDCQYWMCDRVSVDHIGGQHHVGFALETHIAAQTGGKYYLRSVEILGTLSDGVQIGTNGLEVGAIYLSQVTANTCGSGFRITNASYMPWSDVEAVSCLGDAFVCDPGSGQAVTIAFWKGLVADSPGNIGINFTGSGIIAEISMDGCWSANCGQHGIVVGNSALNGLSLTSHRSIHNQRHGVELFAGKNVTISGGQFFNNGRAAPNAYNGINVEPGFSFFSITGANAGSGGFYAQSGEPCQQFAGISVSAGGSDHYVVTGNICSGNLSAGVNDGGTGLIKAVANNVS
ncbi:hypothetical protein GXW71_28150 [Roseomonas hellenica]|uniref:Rhamnogalacturonase A/B/Epimerase-like pectate lyase domain-containing protein n=1 Tax=Plastoroseomonas hellenica TaxID=2687306 RepID=A0ABS5F751_9PROT|nr:glycosyl hydrolase family 28-related protein [Plastoroseomonas hellenica]MBR0668258.1 hypothetical protein [Plastoroseomonas hellenica]